jgi:hypothetical protein
VAGHGCSAGTGHGAIMACAHPSIDTILTEGGMFLAYQFNVCHSIRCCENCQQLLQAGGRKNQRYCGKPCRVKAAEARRKQRRADGAR